jgi:hypothetical protein
MIRPTTEKSEAMFGAAGLAAENADGRGRLGFLA